ncbi:monocarboxylate transporter [Usnea florida]
MELQPSYDPKASLCRTLNSVVRICAFFAVFQTIGPNLSYGVFQTFYTASDQSILYPQEGSNKALIAFIGTLAAGLTWGGSIYVNPLMSRFPNPKHLAVPGCLLMSTAFLLASFSTKTYHLLLTQGLLYGIGSSLLYFPLISIAPEYFDRRRGTAMGLILSAAGLGGVAFSLTIRALLDRVGARWTLRALSLENFLVSLSTALTALPSRSANTPRPTLVNWTIARKPAFILQTLAALLQASGNFVPMTFTPEFSVAVGYTAAFGAVLLAVNNGVNAVSRVLTGVLADAWGRQNVLILSVVGSALSVLVLWMGAAHDDREMSTGTSGDKQGLWVAFVVLYGMLAGGYMALFPVTISEVFGIQAYASVNGFVYFVRGCGAAFGAPVGGQILGEGVGAGSYRRLIWYDGALLLGCSVCVLGVRGFDAVEKRRWRWKA